MSSARGAAGAVKPKLHNVNSVYAGKNQNAVKAGGASKHGGLQSLGKNAAAVRRMPPPATLPSLRAESQGQDPTVALVPQGGSGWHKDSTSASCDTQPANNQTSADSTNSLGSSSLSGGVGCHITDLRPNWAKQPPVSEALGTAPNASGGVTASSRDFPSLAAAAASSGKQPSLLQSDALKPQKSGSWRAGGGSTSVKDGEVEGVATSPGNTMQPHLINTIPRNIEKQLPSRYYDGMATPHQPPNGSYQVPKNQAMASLSMHTNVSNVENSISPAGNNESLNACLMGVNMVPHFPTDLTVPPPNYSHPPPNFFINQQQYQLEKMHGVSTTVSAPSANIRKDYGKSCEEELLSQKFSYGGEECLDSTNSVKRFSANSHNSVDKTQSQNHLAKSSYATRDNKYCKSSNNSNVTDWHNGQYGTNLESDAGSSRWRENNAVDGRYHRIIRERDDDTTHLQMMERESVIERSRQKRRQISQGSTPSDQPPSPAYGTARMSNLFDGKVLSDWDASSTEQAIDNGAYFRDSRQHWNSREHPDDNQLERESERISAHRMLRRSKDDGVVDALQNQLCDVLSHNDEEDDLQLTKLSCPATKVVKRVGPVNSTEKSNQIYRDTAPLPQFVSAVSSSENANHGTMNMQQKTKPLQKEHRGKRDEFSASDKFGHGKSDQIHHGEQSNEEALSTGRQSLSVASMKNPSAPYANIWEKRAEERESAERERQTCKDVGQRNAQHGFYAPHVDSSDNWRDSNYGGNYNSTEYSAFQEDEDEADGLFRGQREFVNSRVSARSSRGVSMSARGDRLSYGRGGGYFNFRRGGLSKHHTDAHNYQMRNDDRSLRLGTRRGRRHEAVEEEKRDKFYNMGEFQVEDTYDTAASTKTTLSAAKTVIADKSQSKGVVERASNIRGKRRSINQRSTQVLYQPRQATHARSIRRGGVVGGSKVEIYSGRSCATEQSAFERSKHKKESIQSSELDEDLSSMKTHEMVDRSSRNYNRSELYKAGHNRNSRLPPHSLRGLHNPSLNPNLTGADGNEDRSKSATNAVKREYGITEMVDYRGYQRRTPYYKGYSNSRANCSSTGQFRENIVNTANGNGREESSKNAKPASTTSRVVGREVQPHKEVVENLPLSVEQPKKDACKDGLAGVDINDAGVIVIDDRPDDDQFDDSAENDFEEVVSKKNKRLRQQQQFNEQMEAEKRKLREKEHVEKRKLRTQSRKVDRKNIKDRTAVSFKSAGNADSTKTAVVLSSVNGSYSQTMNTTVWNSSIIKEQVIPQISSSIETRSVIPSPIARPTPKGSIESPDISKKGVGIWKPLNGEQALYASKKNLKNHDDVKKSDEYTPSLTPNPAQVETGQFDFPFDSSLQNGAQKITENVKKGSNAVSDGAKRSEPQSLVDMSVESNDDENLKQRLDKVKDIWPGQQQFTSGSLLSSSIDGESINSLVKTTATSSISHAPNVAKVRPQPQSHERSFNGVALKETSCSTHMGLAIKPSSPVACIPHGTCLQSCPQVPLPGTFPHYPLILNETYNPNAATSSLTQAHFNTSACVNQASLPSRSRPASCIDQPQLFIHPPLGGAGSGNLAWSTAAAHLEHLTGINATSAHPSHSNSISRFHFATQSRSPSNFAPQHIVAGGGKLAHIAPPLPHRPIPPHVHHHNFSAPPPDFVSSQTTNFGAVGSPRGNDILSQNSVAGSLTRNGVSSLLGQMHVPMQPPVNLSQNSQSAFQMSATSFSQAPPLHTFSTPPPPFRFTYTAHLNDGIGAVTNNWTKSSTVFPMKYSGSTHAIAPIARPAASRSQQTDRWNANNSTVSQLSTNSIFQSDANMKEIVARGSTSDEKERGIAMVGNVNVSGEDTLDHTRQSKKATKV